MGDGFAAEELGNCYTFGGCKGYCGWKNPCTSNFYQAYVCLRVASLYGKCLGCYRKINTLRPDEVIRAETEALAWVKNHPKVTEGEP
jgi:hypothetical protein